MCYGRSAFLFFALSLALTGFFSVAIANAASVSPGAPISVTVSIPPQKFFVDRIGGEDVTVAVMTGKGRDPHSYEPTAAQMAAISKTDLYITIGVPFETQWLPKFRSVNPSLQILSLMDGMERLKGAPDLALRRTAPSREDSHRKNKGHAHTLETDDPHLWLAPALMKKTLPAIVAALGKINPAKATAFARRADVLAAEIESLDTRITALFTSLPSEKRLFLTFHQSWAYYAHNYGLREASVELEGRDPTPKGMVQLMDFAARNNIRVLVADPMTSKSAVAAIAKNIGGTAIIANPLDENWPHAMLDFSEALARALGK